MKKKILILFITLFINVSSVFALTYGGCDYSTISRLKSLVNNVNIVYSYHESEGQILFDVTLSNITPQMYFYDSVNDKYYYYNDTNNGEITINNYYYSQNYKFYSALNECKGVLIGTKYYNFPSYNAFYTDPACSDIPNFSLCQKWVNNSYSYDKFITLINQYKNSQDSKPIEEQNIEYEMTIIDYIIEFYVKYYYYIFIAIILICVSIIIINRRKDRFKL